MKLLTILVSSDMKDEVSQIISEHNIDCYVRIGEAYGISHRCKGSLGDDMPWEARVIMVAGTEEQLVALAEAVEKLFHSKDYNPCLRMMLSPVDRVWMY
jgi:hypothetical protein